MIEILLLVAFSLPNSGNTSSAPGVIYAAAPESRGAFHVGGKGVYSYGYNTGDGHAKVEVKHPDGSIYGSYRYFDANGLQVVRSYIADRNGFRVLGNNLPIAPDTPTVGLIGDQTLLGAVEGDNDASVVANPPPTYVSPIVSYNAGLQRHREAVRRHEENIRRQNELIQRQTGYIETSDNLIRSPYLYTPDNINYDFPAGFAYDTTPVYQYRVVYPVSARGYHKNPSIAAGHVTETRQNRPIYVKPRKIVRTRYRRPNLDKYWKKRSRPFVIGHAK